MAAGWSATVHVRGSEVPLEESKCRRLAEGQRVGHLATADNTGKPHLVPVTFVVVAEQLAIGIDEKPKRSTNLKRLRNIEENNQVALLWDRYSEEWSELWWVRADGCAEILTSGTDWQAAWSALNAKYEQYEGRVHAGPVISMTVEKWSGWSYR